MINHTLRGDPYYHQARRLIAEGMIGQVLSVTMSWAGRLFLTGTHHFDLVNYLLGDEPTAWLVGHIEQPDHRQPAVATPTRHRLRRDRLSGLSQRGLSVLQRRDGTSWRRLDVIGREGAIWIDGQDAQLYRVDPKSRFRDLLRHPYPQMMRYTAPMTYLLDDLMASIETGIEPLSSGHTARNAVAQVIATHISSADGNRKVDFPVKDLDARAHTAGSAMRGPRPTTLRPKVLMNSTPGGT